MDKTSSDSKSTVGERAGPSSVDNRKSNKTSADTPETTDTDESTDEFTDASMGSTPPSDCPFASLKRAWALSPETSEDERPLKRPFGDMRRYLVEPEEIQVSFDDIHVHPSIVEALNAITLPLDCSDAFRHGILSKSWPAPVLLYGPPGSGKTQLVRALAKKARCKILAVSSADVHDKHASVAQKKIQNLFQLARREHPCILFLDDADCLFRARSAEPPSEDRSLLHAFLASLDGSTACRGPGSPLVIAATSRPFDMDEAILRRLRRRVLVGLPDAAAREKILAIHARDETLAPDVSLAALALATAGYSGSDLRNLVYAAALEALREAVHGPQAHHRTPGAHRVLRREHFAYARRQTPPAPVADTVARIREFHNRHGATLQAKPGSGAADKIKAPVAI